MTVLIVLFARAANFVMNAVIATAVTIVIFARTQLIAGTAIFLTIYEGAKIVLAALP